MERFNRLKELINEYNQPATLSPVIVPEDGLSFFYSLKANIHLNRDLLGDTSYLQHILANDGQNLRTEWIDEYKEILTRCNRSDELVNKWDQVWEEFKKIGFKSSDELNKLFLMFSAYKTRRHLVIIDDSSDNTSNSSDFIILVSGDIICENNVANSSPILLCRVKSQDHRQHFQLLISTDSQFWRQFCEENIRYNKTGSNLIIIKRQNIDSRSNIQIKKEQLHYKPQELKSFHIKSQNMNSEETLNHHLVELSNDYNVKEQSIDLTKELTDITDIESHSCNAEDIIKLSIEDPLQDFQNVQDVDNTPKVNLEPVLGIFVKEESLLEPSEIKTEPLEYPQLYLLSNFDEIAIKNEVKSEILDYTDEQDCGLLPIDGKAKYLEIDKFTAMEKDPEEEVNERKRRAREKARLRQQAYKRRKMEEDPEGFREKQNESKRRLKMKKMQEEDPEGFKLRQLEYRRRKMQEDPEVVNEKKREKNRLRQQAFRQRKMEQDPDGFKLRKLEYRRRKLEEDPEAVKEKKREKNRLIQQAFRQRKMEQDPEGFKLRKREYRRRKLEEDPEVIKERKREKNRLRQQAFRQRKMEQDPEGFKLRKLEYRRRKGEEDPEVVREKVNEKKREQNRLRQQAFRRRKMEEDTKGVREEEKERLRRYRMKKMQEDPEGFREKKNERQRMKKMQEVLIEKEKDRLKQMEYRKKRMEEDPEGFKEKVNERKGRHRLENMEQDPENKVRNEESKLKEVDYREGDFMGHQMESSDSFSEGDEDNSFYKYISEEYEDVSIELQNEVDPIKSDHTKLVAGEKK